MNTTQPRHSVSVSGVIPDDHGRVLLIRRRDNQHWEPPGGVLELGETIEDGLRREMREERSRSAFCLVELARLELATPCLQRLFAPGGDHALLLLRANRDAPSVTADGLCALSDQACNGHGPESRAVESVDGR